MIIIYIVTSLNKSNSKQGDIKVLMITFLYLECLVFFEEDSNMHKPCSIFVYLSLIFSTKLCISIHHIGNMYFNAIIPFSLLYNIKPFLACVLAFIIKIRLA